MANDRPGDDSTAGVVPVNWQRFRSTSAPDEDYRDSVKLLVNSLRFNLNGATKCAEDLEGALKSKQKWDPVKHAAYGVFPAGCIALGYAVAVRTGTYDEKAIGVPQAVGLERIVRMLKVSAEAYRQNGAWGYPWQSARFAALVGQAGWMLWDQLDAEAQAGVAFAVEAESNRLLKYNLPYWNGHGGQSPIDEHAWNSMVLHVAVAMMPNHPNVPKWKEKCSEMMASAFSVKADIEDTTVLDGRPVNQWVKGWNVRDDGAVIHHGLLHPDYMVCIYQNLRSFIVQSLAGQPVPETADRNAAFIYKTLVAHEWPAPPYKRPGGTIYVPGKALAYYPEGTDWSPNTLSTFYLLDGFVHLLELDKGLAHPAGEWRRLRVKKMLEFQARHPDGHMYAKGEFDSLPIVEQVIPYIAGDIVLLHWLRDQKAISRKENWLKQ